MARAEVEQELDELLAREVPTETAMKRIRELEQLLANGADRARTPWDEYAEASASHRCVTDPDVAAMLCECRHDGELERLRRAGRL